jgi:hypothetical protein
MIQIDMFEVQLGAALLVQFKTKAGTVIRVLADAGVGKGLPPDHVHRKLPAAFDSFGGGDHRIDLLIGTHYDADHLDGLIPIIRDKTISITEAWLPPVANDSDFHSFDEPVADQDLLARQFYRDHHRQTLIRYLETKKEICERIRPRNQEERGEYRSTSDWNEENVLDSAPPIFKHFRDEALAALGSNTEISTHADDVQFGPANFRELLRSVDMNYLWEQRWLGPDWMLYQDQNFVLQEVTRGERLTSSAAHNFAWIRKAAARDAINAISLAKVVEALRARRVPIHCQIIPNGAPQRFVWRKESRRFEGGARLRAQGPQISLLGPSESLVTKNWNRLPIGTYTAFAAFASIPLKNITPSNQLSYVLRLDAEGQGILVAGDAGCVDFKPAQGRPYYKELLAALLPLQVVQVAHHAGNNAHFYRVLGAANYPKGVTRSYLLVSHATDDPHRPSREFGQFVRDVRREPEVAEILFTAQPSAEKVRGFESLVHRPVGKTAREGDARLGFRNGTWTVTKHAIQV